MNITRFYYMTMVSLFIKGLFFKKANDENLGVVGNQYKEILDGEEYTAYIDNADVERISILKNTTIEDSVQLAIEITNKYAYQTKRLANLFDKNLSIIDLLEQVYNFVFYHIRYKLDAKDNEEIRKPSRTWHDRKTGVDCDCFSVFIGSILKNIDIPFVFRIADYGNGWQHIYVVVVVAGEKEIPIDPVIRKFNYEKPYQYKKDYRV